MDEHTILFVDDEENILRTIKRLFFEEGYRVLTADSGQAALDLINGGETPSVIVSDQRMPQMSGAEFLVKAKEKLPQSIRMVLTGYADVNAAVDAINLGGIYRYILKPWNDDDLKLTVREAVERFELVAQNKRLTSELKEKNQELGVLNESLEEKVKERTSELQEALSKNQRLNVALAHKVKELEGRDRIQQHLLTIHTIEETLQLILEVIGEQVKMDAAAIYLAGKSSEEFEIAAVHSELKAANTLFEDTGKEDSVFASYKASLLKSFSTGKPIVLHREDVWIGDMVNPMVRFALLPIIKEDHPLGAIVIARNSDKPFSEGNLRTITSFSMQAAIAISDSLMTQDLPSLEGVLDDVLMDLPGD